MKQLIFSIMIFIHVVSLCMPFIVINEAVWITISNLLLFSGQRMKNTKNAIMYLYPDLKYGNILLFNINKYKFYFLVFNHEVSPSSSQIQGTIYSIIWLRYHVLIKLYLEKIRVLVLYRLHYLRYYDIT